MYSHADLPNPPAPERPRVEIVSTKNFLHYATQSGTYGDITWLCVLQPTVNTSDCGATEYPTCSLAVNLTLEAAENTAGNMAEPTTYWAIYHSSSEVAASSIEQTILSVPSGSKSNQLALE